MRKSRLEAFLWVLIILWAGGEYAMDEHGRQGNPSPVDSFQAAVSDIKHTVYSIRKLAQKLQPMWFGYRRIRSAVSWIGEETAYARPGLPIELHIEVEKSQVREDLKTVVFRTIEDLLRNIAAHGPTGRVKVSLEDAEQRLVLTINTPMPTALSDLPGAGAALLNRLDLPKPNAGLNRPAGILDLRPRQMAKQDGRLPGR